MVGCQVGGDCRSNIYYLVVRRCVHTVGIHRGTTIAEASMPHRSGSASRVYCEPVWYMWVSVGEKMGGEWSVNKMWPSVLIWGYNNGTYVWLAAVLHGWSWSSCHVACFLQSFAIHSKQRGCVLLQRSMCGSLTCKPLFFLIRPNYVVPFLFTHPTFLGTT
jgi:hypothetical protein